MSSFWERQYRKLPQPVKDVVEINVEAAKQKTKEELKKLAQPAADIIAEKTKEAGAKSIGPWVATAAIVLALLYVSKRGR